MVTYQREWLYVRGNRSVRIAEMGPRTLLICGPGTRRILVQFGGARQAIAFRKRRADRLGAAGFRSLGPAADRRQRPDRRQTARGGADRRQTEVIGEIR
jgi:hypothetical protein